MRRPRGLTAENTPLTLYIHIYIYHFFLILDPPLMMILSQSLTDSLRGSPVDVLVQVRRVAEFGEGVFLGHYLLLHLSADDEAQGPHHRLAALCRLQRMGGGEKGNENSAISNPLIV